MAKQGRPKLRLSGQGGPDLGQGPASGSLGRDFMERLADLITDNAEQKEFVEALSRVAKLGERVLRPHPHKFRWPQSYEARDWIVGPLQRGPLASSIEYGAGSFFFQEAFAHEVAGMIPLDSPDEKRSQGRDSEVYNPLVLDRCAAPGAKSTALLERLDGRGWVVACDVDRRRLATLDALVARSGYVNVSLHRMGEWQGPRECFDVVLLDVPCSGETLFAKRSEQRSDVYHSEVRRFTHEQRRLLDESACLVKPGGSLVYATCTYNRDENEAIVHGFLSSHPEWSVQREIRRWPHRDHIPGGYAALLKRQGQAERYAPSEITALVDKIPHCFRRGMMTPTGMDWYAAAMNHSWETVSDSKEAEIFVGDVELDVVQAKAYLNGQAIAGEFPLRGMCRVRHRDLVLGPAKAVAGRLNNLLPRALRES